MDVRTEKRILRRALLGRIAAMDLAHRQREERALIDACTELPGFARAELVLLYASAFPEEVSTRSLLEGVLTRGKRLVCPRVDRLARRLVLLEVTEPAPQLEPGWVGIPEPGAPTREISPEKIDWALVPGLGFDDRGFRLGRGGGYYDRLLPSLRGDTPRWALALTPQWVERLPVEPHDQPLSGVAFPDRWIALR